MDKQNHYSGEQNLELNIREDHDAIIKEAVQKIKNGIEAAAKESKSFTLGLATGSTMEPLYKELVRMHKDEGLSFENVNFFNLDNYIGIDENDRNSYSRQLKDIFLDKVDAKTENINLVSTSASFDHTAYEQKIKDMGGIDIQLLGIGGEGHIGFNEVGSDIKSRTRKVQLSERTKDDNGKYFSRPGEIMPNEANTMGIGTILEAKEVLLLANGANKALTVKKMMDASDTAPNYSATTENLQQVIYDKRNNHIDNTEARVDTYFDLNTDPTDTTAKQVGNNKPVRDLPVRSLHMHPKVTVLIDKDAAQLSRVSDLVNHSDLENAEIEELLARNTPQSVMLSIDDMEKPIWLSPKFDFYDPNGMSLDEPFNPKSTKHQELLQKALNNTTDIGIGAHQDDIEIMAPVQLLEATKDSEKEWMSLIVTDGAMSTSKIDSDYTVKQLTDMRHREQREAAQIAGTPVIQLNYPSAAVNDLMGELKKNEAVQVLSSLFEAMPNVKRLSGHNPIDKHPTHLGVLAVQTGALRQSGVSEKLEKVTGMKVWGGLNGIPDNQREMFVITSNDEMDKIKKLIDVYKSQILGQNRDYSQGTIDEAKGNAAFATDPHDNATPKGAWVGVDLTEQTKNLDLQTVDMAQDILDRAAAVKVKEAGKHAIRSGKQDGLPPWRSRMQDKDASGRNR